MTILDTDVVSERMPVVFTGCGLSGHISALSTDIFF